MKTIIKWIALLFLTNLFTGVSAQCVYEEGNKVYLDLTEKYGMPKGSTTNIPKYTGTYVGSDFQYIVNPAFAISENEKMYEKLEIAKEDLPLINGKDLTWAQAFDGCLAKGEDWRLPTQCELIYMWVFKEPLNTLTGTDFREYLYNPHENIGVEYWSATEFYYDTGSAGNQAWNVDFNVGYSTGSNKEMGKAVRCVREVK